jgi:hypothetical protein
MSEPTQAQLAAAASVALSIAQTRLVMESERPDPKWSKKELRLIDDWRTKQSEPLGRSEAIRRLVEIGLKAKGK